MAANDLGGVLAAVHHLHVVERDHRQAVVYGKEITPAFEIGDYDVGLKPLDDIEVRAHVARPASGDGAPHVLE